MTPITNVLLNLFPLNVAYHYAPYLHHNQLFDVSLKSLDTLQTICKGRLSLYILTIVVVLYLPDFFTTDLKMLMHDLEIISSKI